MADVKRAEVLVIGGGFTGTQAALSLANAGVDVALLEAGPKLGGRVKSFDYTPPNGGQRFTFEHGAQYVGVAQTEIMKLIQEHLPDALVDGYAARLPYRDQIAVLDGVRFQYNRDNCLFGIGGVPPTLDLWSLIGALLLIMEIESIEQQIDVAEPWNSPPSVTPLDAITMEQWLGRPWIPPLSRALMAMSVQALLSVETREVSAFYFHWYCACNGGFLNEVNDEEGGPQQYYLSTGFDALIDRTVAPIRDRIHCDAPVQTIRTESGGAPLARDGESYVSVTLQNGDVWEAKKVIVAMSPASYGRLTYQPDLPEKRRELASQPMGRTIKCNVFYRTPWWRDSHGLHYTGYAGAASNEVLWVMDYTPVIPDGQASCFSLMTFTVGRFVDALGPFPSKEEVTAKVTENLSFLFNDTRALTSSREFVGLVTYTWNPAQSFVGGGPNTVMGPGLLTGPDCAGRLLNEPWGDVYFASAETARKASPSSPATTHDGTGYSDHRQSLGYMDGAIVSGRFVAAQVLADLGKGPAVAKPAASASPAAAAGAPPAPPDAPEPLTIDQVKAVVEALSVELYSQSALDFPTWEKNRWYQDASALLTWLSVALGGALVKAGLLPPPPSKPPPLSWMMQFMKVGQALVASGYAYANSKDTSAPGIQDVRAMTAIADALMQLMSSEPYGTPPPTTGAPSHRIPGRLASLLGLLRRS
ncbi:MAG: FAD-dependent oxidoreductase [Polyangiaceae bacterium]